MKAEATSHPHSDRLNSCVLVLQDAEVKRPAAVSGRARALPVLRRVAQRPESAMALQGRLHPSHWSAVSPFAFHPLGHEKEIAKIIHPRKAASKCKGLVCGEIPGPARPCNEATCGTVSSDGTVLHCPESASCGFSVSRGQGGASMASIRCRGPSEMPGRFPHRPHRKSV